MARHLLGTFGEKSGKKVSGFAARIFLQEKLNNWLGYFLMACLACILGLLVSVDIAAGLALFSLFLGLLLLIVFITDPETAFYFFLFVAFWIYFFRSCFFHGDLLVGVPYDIIAVLTFFGLMISKPDFRSRFKSFYKIPVVQYFFIVIFCFNLLETFNPGTRGQSEIIPIARKFMDFFVAFFGAYMLIDTTEKVRKFSNILLFAAGTSALYGCIQEWHGYYSWDLEQIMSDPHAFALLFVNGELRKYGSMADPSEYGLLMAACTLYFFILGIFEKNKGMRAWYLIGAFFMFLAVGYSGTRTAYATLVVGLAFFILLNFQRPAVRGLSILAVGAFLLLMYGPGESSAPIRRFRTTFQGSKDESYKVRVEARAYIQPFILSHPFGGGLGTTNGSSRDKDNDHSGNPLTGFQTDGSYVLKATETGYVGLILVCILYFQIMFIGIKGYFRARDPVIKVYYSACLSAIFSLYVGEYTQNAVGGVSDSLFYFPAIAIMLNLKSMDKQRT
jgi:putative inorganic carbon (HCO3(-)) transporter